MRTGPTRSTSPACFLARLRRDFRAVYLAGLLCCAMLLPACLLVWLGVYLRMFWLSLAGGAAGGLLGAQGVCGLFDTLLRSRRGRLGAWWPGYCAAFRQNARDALPPLVRLLIRLRGPRMPRHASPRALRPVVRMIAEIGRHNGNLRDNSSQTPAMVAPTG